LEAIFDLKTLESLIVQIEERQQEPEFWNDPETAQSEMKRLSRLKGRVNPYRELDRRLNDILEMREMLRTEPDAEMQELNDQEALQFMADMEAYELQTLLNGEYDDRDAIVEVNAGAGGSEACDWASILFRMYQRWCENKGYKCEVISETPGDVTGYRSVQFAVGGPNAYGYLKAENGVHRLVRISPFDAAARRHTSFCKVEVLPEMEETEIDINMDDVKEETLRAGGAGGQHVNKTESAVRITHHPSGIVVQCQNDRSQHRNRDEAMKMLRARLFELEMRKRRAEQDKVEASKTDIGWGHQIRSYVLDQSRIKDLRTNVEISNTRSVLDGDLDEFIAASLKQGV
jgi:peptide chain release factor 2